MNMRSLLLGLLVMIMGTVKTNQQEMMAFLCQCSEEEARECVYSQYESEIRYAADSMFESVRLLALESVLCWIASGQKEDWKRTAVFSVLAVAGLSDLANMIRKFVQLGKTVTAREMLWKHVLGMRQQFAMQYSQMMSEQEFFDAQEESEEQV